MIHIIIVLNDIKHINNNRTQTSSNTILYIISNKHPLQTSPTQYQQYNKITITNTRSYITIIIIMFINCNHISIDTRPYINYYCNNLIVTYNNDNTQTS